MNKSILVIDTPSSCSECKLGFLQNNYLTCIEDDFGLTSDYDYENEVDTRCPLISIDIDELEEAFKTLENTLSENDGGFNGFYERPDEIQIIKSTIDKLKGVK